MRSLVAIEAEIEKVKLEKFYNDCDDDYIGVRACQDDLDLLIKELTDTEDILKKYKCQ